MNTIVCWIAGAVLGWLFADLVRHVRRISLHIACIRFAVERIAEQRVAIHTTITPPADLKKMLSEIKRSAARDYRPGGAP